MVTDPATVLAALRTARTGQIYDLGTELGPHIPSGDPETFVPIRISPFRIPRAVTEDEPPAFDFSMEIISGSPHVGSHIDGLSHIHAHGQMHGGVRTRDAWTDFGWRVGGAETMPPFVIRGVLIDWARHRGVEMIDGAAELGVSELEACLEADGIELREPTAVLVRTGKIAQFHTDGDAYYRVQPGVGPAAGVRLHELGMRLLGTDTSGTEPHPMPNPTYTTHGELLVKRGVHLLEILDLDALAAAGLREFCLVVLPLKLVGATGSWVRPIAIG